MLAPPKLAQPCPDGIRITERKGEFMDSDLQKVIDVLGKCHSLVLCWPRREREVGSHVPPGPTLLKDIEEAQRIVAARSQT